MLVLSEGSATAASVFCAAYSDGRSSASSTALPS